ncbi:MAG: type 1 glutamine amidotransferase [Candidatus Eisenbacteria bacterium]|uniref:Type 1 glutamine amidotransferase n=1 Tax=Eiseniibacteriota bacterium TaxID=2212470 RepID=A0A538T0T3_UNCEI|nr:MAG: type 1 glutamine amidotransferase [Candidatus Eisenbacteria bacterium]
MTRPWALIQHVPSEGPGLIASEAASRGIPLDVRRMFAGDPLPAPGEIAGLVVMGGPMAANDDAAFPNLARERDLLAGAARAGIPVLGICLGAQLLAAALGGRVSRGLKEEIGFGEVTLTEEGSRDPILGRGARSVPVFQWHGDTFDLPKGAVLLASSPGYPNQAFRLGDRVYGFQFHVEADRDLLDAWIPLLASRGARVDRSLHSGVERTGRRILAAFFATKSGPTPAVR